VRTAAVVVGALAVIAGSPWIGPRLDAATGEFVLETLRLPRAGLGVLVGAALGATGAAWQALLDNPIAAPSTTGTLAGASLGALAVLVAAPAAGAWAVAGAAFVGALGASVAAVLVATRRAARVDDVLLAGVALTLAAAAVTTGLQVRADVAATARAVRWSLGSLSVVGWDPVVVVLVGVAPSLAVLVAQGRALDALVEGDEVAAARGVDVPRVRATVLAAGSLAVAAGVAVAGPIGFVGLVVPHVVRRVASPRRAVVLALSSVVGSAFLVACDALARLAGDVPVGALTAAIGAPALFAVILQRVREGR
jgi:iron complex transport system permease protein